MKWQMQTEKENKYAHAKGSPAIKLNDATIGRKKKSHFDLNIRKKNQHEKLD